jgi:hypothetical protein
MERHKLDNSENTNNQLSKILINTAWGCIFTAFTVIFISIIMWFTNPRTDNVKENRLKLKNMYGVPDELLSTCDPLETQPLPEICNQYIRPK